MQKRIQRHTKILVIAVSFQTISGEANKNIVEKGGCVWTWAEKYVIILDGKDSHLLLDFWWKIVETYQCF